VNGNGGHRRVLWIVRAALVVWLIACIVAAFRPTTETIDSLVVLPPTPEGAAVEGPARVTYDCPAAMRADAPPQQHGDAIVISQARPPCSYRTSQRVTFYVDVVVGMLALAATSRRVRTFVAGGWRREHAAAMAS